MDTKTRPADYQFTGEHDFSWVTPDMFRDKLAHCVAISVLGRTDDTTTAQFDSWIRTLGIAYADIQERYNNQVLEELCDEHNRHYDGTPMDTDEY